MAEFEKKVMVCPKCGHRWFAKVIEGKVWYQCSQCKFMFKLSEG